MFNQKDVAKIAGVSVMTVSRVINNKGYVKEETRKRVHDAINKLDYYPNNAGRSLNMNKVNIIAVLSPIIGGAIENDPYFNRLLYGIESVLVKYGYDLLLSTQRQRLVDGEYQFDYFRPFMERKADALILLGANLNSHHFEMIEKNRITFCIIGDRPDTNVIDVVDSNNRGGIKIIMEKLYNLGHRRIAFGGYNRANFNISERCEGYREFLKDMGIKVREDYIFLCDEYYHTGHLILDAWQKLADRPTAIVCSTDNYAIEVIQEAKERGIPIASELSVTGFDGIPLGQYMEPSLVSLKQPLEEMGMKAAELILERLQNPEKEYESHFFDVSLQEGTSIAPPSASGA